MWFRKKIENSPCVGVELVDRSKARHEVYCALCGVPRYIAVDSPKLTPFQHIQTVLFSVFLAWALFPIFGVGSMFLYPFVWAAADLGKKGMYRRGAQCKACGFDAVTYKKDVRKAKLKIKSHLDSLPHRAVFKHGYHPKPEEEKPLKNYFNL
jgi:ribosomal protein L37E